MFSGNIDSVLVECLNKRTERLAVYRISLEKDIELVYLREVEDAQYTIIYDEFNCHYDVIKNNDIQLCDDVFFSSGSIIKNGKEIFTPRELNVNNSVKNKYIIDDNDLLSKIKII